MKRLKRVWFDVCMFAFVGFMLFTFPTEKQGLQLFLYKALLVNAGFLHCHITRKLCFPYIDFRSEKEWSNNLLVISLYIVFIWAYAKGG